MDHGLPDIQDDDTIFGQNARQTGGQAGFVFTGYIN
jgi:hypothetical protein